MNVYKIWYDYIAINIINAELIHVTKYTESVSFIAEAKHQTEVQMR